MARKSAAESWYGPGAIKCLERREAGFLTRSGAKNIFGNTKTNSSQVLEQYEVEGDDFLHCIGQGDDSWLHQFICKQNEYGMARNSNHKQDPQSAGPRELSLAMLKDSNRSSFCHKETPSMSLVTSRHSTSFVMHRMTNVRGRNRSCCNTTTQGTTLFVCRGTAFRPMAETSLPEGLSLASTDYHHTRDQQCATDEAVQEDVLRWLQTAEQKFYRLARWKKALTAILY